MGISARLNRIGVVNRLKNATIDYFLKKKVKGDKINCMGLDKLDLLTDAL